MQENLHQQFIQLGRERNKLTYKLLQLLPEIFKSGIYRKYATTIEEYAGRFGGLPKSLVKKRLNLEKHLQDKPALKEAIATQGVYKVALVARVATAENQAEIAEKVENMSKSALEMFSKELRKETKVEQVELASSREEVPSEENVKITLEGELLFKFLRLKNKFNKNTSNKEIIRTIIEKAYEQEFKKEDKKVEQADFSAGKIKELSREKAHMIFLAGKSAREKRYIPIERRRIALKQNNNRCGYPTCPKPYDLFHHPERYSLTKNHENIVPLCKEHHEFAHNGLMERREQRLKFIDDKYQAARQLAMA